MSPYAGEEGQVQWPAPVRNQVVPTFSGHWYSISNPDGIAKIYDYGYEDSPVATADNKLYMVIDLLGSSLEDLFQAQYTN